MSIEFIYFDLGNVLVSFCHERMCRQMAEVAEIEPSRIHETLFETESQRQFETGELNPDDYFDLFCRTLDRQPDRARLERAASDIFSVRSSILPIVAGLTKAKRRMAILSNTNETHWRFLNDGRFDQILPGPFEHAVLSFEERSMKPDQKIYQSAITRAGVAPEKILFIDDLPENVAGARAAGIDAVQFTNEEQLLADLRARDIPLEI